MPFFPPRKKKQHRWNKGPFKYLQAYDEEERANRELFLYGMVEGPPTKLQRRFLAAQETQRKLTDAIFPTPTTDAPGALR